MVGWMRLDPIMVTAGMSFQAELDQVLSDPSSDLFFCTFCAIAILWSHQMAEPIGLI